MTMDGSKRSAHSNAFIIGLKGARRIVLFDTLIPKLERKELIGDYTPLGYKYEAIIRKKKDKDLKPLIVTLPHGIEPQNVPFNYHNGDEMIYVLAGKMMFFYGDDQYAVEEGDCLYFDSTIPHKVVAAEGKEPVKLLSILSL